MTGRKPPAVSWESWIERQIREGMERGEFEGLPGTGAPIADLDEAHDEMRWVREKLRREEVSVLPPALAVRRELDDTMARIDAAASEATVRRLVAEINRRIVEVNTGTLVGPPSTLAPLDVDAVVARWRQARDRP